MGLSNAAPTDIELRFSALRLPAAERFSAAGRLMVCIGGIPAICGCAFCNTFVLGADEIPEGRFNDLKLLVSDDAPPLPPKLPPRTYAG